MLACNIKKKVFYVLNSFLSFLRKYERRITHNMFYLMVNPKRKNLDLVALFIGHEQGVAIVEEYDRKFYVSCS